MRVTRTRANVVTLIATSQEVSALVSGARMALALMRADPNAPAAASDLASLLTRVLADYERALSARDGEAPCMS